MVCAKSPTHHPPKKLGRQTCLHLRIMCFYHAGRGHPRPTGLFCPQPQSKLERGYQHPDLGQVPTGQLRTNKGNLLPYVWESIFSICSDATSSSSHWHCSFASLSTPFPRCAAGCRLAFLLGCFLLSHLSQPWGRKGTEAQTPGVHLLPVFPASCSPR